MTDYLVYREGSELKLALHAHYREDDLLIRGFVPGKDLVIVPDVVGVDPETLDEAARRHAEMYFRGGYQDSKSIDCWVAGALERQKCLKANAPSNRS